MKELVHQMNTQRYRKLLAKLHDENETRNHTSHNC